jgi:hypothetical protein
MAAIDRLETERVENRRPQREGSSLQTEAQALLRAGVPRASASSQPTELPPLVLTSGDGEVRQSRAHDSTLLGDRAARRQPPERASSPAGSVEQERNTLTQAATERIRDAGERQEFIRTMERFEAAARERGLTQAQVAETYRQMHRMINADVAALPQRQRNMIAQQTLEHAINPSGIDQGQNGTCSAAALQERVFNRNPERAAEMIASGATLGRWTSTDGQVIRLDRTTLLPGVEERMNPTPDGARTQASQLFQVVALNDIYQHLDRDLRFVNRPGDPTFIRDEDVGERLQYADGRPMINSRGRNLGRQQVFPGIPATLLAEEADRLGQPGTVLFNRQLGYAPGTREFNNPQELHNLLAQTARNGGFPVMVFVDVNNPQFKEQYRPNSTEPGGHFVSITGYDPITQRIQVSNQWGSRNDYNTDLINFYDITYHYIGRNPI